MTFHFNKRADAPLHYDILRCFGEISDGITGLFMLPFGRFGTQFGYTMVVKILRWQTRKRKALTNIN